MTMSNNENDLLQHRCQNCGCLCENYYGKETTSDDSVVVHLYQEIEHLKKQLSERDYHIVQMETTVMNHAKEYPNGEMVAIEETLRFWQEKYNRLLESHRKLQKVNQALEDKLLKIVDKFETDKSALLKDVGQLTAKLVEARVVVSDLEDENEKLRSDCSLAVQLLQCKPSSFLSHKVDTLPSDVQEKVKLHFCSTAGHKRSKSIPTGLTTPRRCLSDNNQLASSNNHNSSSNSSNSSTASSKFIEKVDNLSEGGKIIRVPIPTFPPTAMVYSVNKVNQSRNQSNDNLSNATNVTGEEKSDNYAPDYVSAAILAKVLEERSKERQAKIGSRYQKCYQCRSRHVDHIYCDDTTQTANSIITNEDLQTNPWIYWSSYNRKRTESTSSGTSVDSNSGSVGGSFANVNSFARVQQYSDGGNRSIMQSGYELRKKPSETII